MKNERSRNVTETIKNVRYGIRDFVDRDGNILPIQDVEIPNYTVDKDQIRLCLDMSNVFIHSRLLSDVTKKFLLSNESSMSKFVQRYNESIEGTDKTKLNYNSVQSSVYYDNRKLLKVIGEKDPYLFVLRYNLDKKLEGYLERYAALKEKISRLNSLYSGEESPVYGEMLIDIKRDVYNSELSDKEFESFFDNIRWYSKAVRDSVEKMITDREAGYFNYLLSSNSLTDKEKARKDLIEKVFCPQASNNDK